LTRETKSARNIHFIGVGGVGMSGIALVAAQRGLSVSGSDLKESRASRKLAEAGVRISIGHDAANIDAVDPDIVVVSSAIPESNPELTRAREKGLEVWPRARMLAWLGRGHRTLAVAGTHGKTTTSSMLATTLDRLQQHPTFLIGGTVDGYDTNAVDGGGDYFVVEADESDGSFMYLDPFVAVVTNIEADHLDHYGTLENIESAFVDFMSQVPADGAVVICGEDPRLPRLARRSGRKVITYGFSEDCDLVCRMKQVVGSMTAFEVTYPDERRVTVTLAGNPGRHNALNGTAVLATLWHLGFDIMQSAHALSAFSGVRRRFDHVALAGGVEIVDDYGHHPTEIAATIAAASTLGYRRVHVLFQPHRYTRTESLAGLFGSAFDLADTVTFMDVYSAGEAPIPGVNGKTLVQSVLMHDPRAQVAWMPHRADVVPYMVGLCKPGDLLITMGAGDVTTMGPLIAEQLGSRG